MINKIIDIKNKAIEGEISNLDAYLMLTEISKQVEAAKDEIKKDAYDEVEKTGEKLYMHKGYKISCQSKTTWDYKHIPSWTSKKDELTEIETLAKTAASSKLDVNSETGEQIIPAIAKYSYFLKIEQ